MKKVTTAGRWAQVKMGKKERSAEEPEFQARVHVYDEDKQVLKQLLYDFEKEAGRLQSRVDTADEFGAGTNFDRIATYAAERKSNYEDSARAFSDTDKEVVEKTRKMLARCKELLVDPARSLAKEDFTMAHKLKQNYNAAHLALDAYKEKWNSAKEGEPKQKAQASMDEAQQEYNQAKDAFLRQLDVVEKNKEALLSQNLPKYRQEIADYYRAIASIYSA